jgi:hypothetical protein
MGIDIHHLVIEPLSAPWQQTPAVDHFKSGCAPVEALARAHQLIIDGTQAVVISGEDELKSGYQREERLRLMSVYEDDLPLTQLYTDLARQFIHHHDIDEQLFKDLCEALFDNYKRSYRHALSDDFCETLLPAAKWYNPITELFRGVDCANPLVDFCGRVLLCSSQLAAQLDIPAEQWIIVDGVGLSVLDGDGPEYIDQIVDYQHLKLAYEQACTAANIDFADQFRQGRALLETYTCYPVVPMAFMLVSGLVDVLEDIPEFLRQHSITITGGMNLARAPWNNPALNGIIDMVQRLKPSHPLQKTGEQYGLIHANGGLGYRQGVAIISSNR